MIRLPSISTWSGEESSSRQIINGASNEMPSIQFYFKQSQFGLDCLADIAMRSPSTHSPLSSPLSPSVSSSSLSSPVSPSSSSSVSLSLSSLSSPYQSPSILPSLTALPLVSHAPSSLMMIKPPKN